MSLSLANSTWLSCMRYRSEVSAASTPHRSKIDIGPMAASSFRCGVDTAEHAHKYTVRGPRNPKRKSQGKSSFLATKNTHKLKYAAHRFVVQPRQSPLFTTKATISTTYPATSAPAPHGFHYFNRCRSRGAAPVEDIARTPHQFMGFVEWRQPLPSDVRKKRRFQTKYV